jgi:hypothetical protein
VRTVKSGCGTTPDGGGTFNVRKTENCEFDIGLDLTIPVIVPPCPIINGGRVNVNATYGGCDTTPDSRVRVTPRTTDPCGDGACEFDIELDINVNIPTPPCPKINGGGIKVTSGYGQCGGTNDGTIKVTPRTVLDKCGNAECEFDITADINVVVPFPGCVQFSRNVSTGPTPSFDIRQVASPSCGDDGEPCSYVVDVVFPEVPPAVCTNVTGGNISIAFSQSNQAYGNINVRPVKPTTPDATCEFEVTGQLVIPSPPPIYPPNNPGGSNKPCIPKYSGGDIKITGNCGGSGKIKVGMSQAQKNQTDPYCVYCKALVPIDNTAGSCLVTRNYGTPGLLVRKDCYTFGLHPNINNCEDCRLEGGNSYECFPQSNNCNGAQTGVVGPGAGGTGLAITADDASAVVIPVEWECQEYACENFSDQDDPEAACAALSGTLRTGPCSGGGVSQSSCQDLEITAEINLSGDCGGTNNPADPNNPDDPNNNGCGPLPEGGEVTVNGKSAGKLVVKKYTTPATPAPSPGAAPPVDPNTTGWCKLPNGDCTLQEKGDCEAADGFNGTWYPEENGGCSDSPSSSTTSSSAPCYTITAELNIPGVDMEGSSSSSGGGGGGGGSGCVPKGGRIQADGKDVGSIKIDEEDTPDTGDVGSCRIRGDCLSGYARGTCEEEGGQWFSSGDCSESAPCYKITADLSLNDLLKDLEFEEGEKNYNKGDCDTEPSVSVEIKRGDNGKYKINTTLSFPDLKKCCCSIKEDAEVENPGVFES